MLSFDGYLACEAGVICVKGVSPGLLFAIDSALQNIWGMGRHRRDACPKDPHSNMLQLNFQNTEKSLCLKSIEVSLLRKDRHVAPLTAAQTKKEYKWRSK